MEVHKNWTCAEMQHRPLVSAPAMGGLRLVNANQFLSHCIVAMVLHTVRCDVTVVVATLPMVTEAVGVLHTQIQPLSGRERKLYTPTSITSYLYMHACLQYTIRVYYIQWDLCIKDTLGLLYTEVFLMQHV